MQEYEPSVRSGLSLPERDVRCKWTAAHVCVGGAAALLDALSARAVALLGALSARAVALLGTLRRCN